MTTDSPTQDDLAAGRELDAEVATKVMRWTLVEYPGGDDHWRDSEGRQMPVTYWRPSTGLVDAWQVLDEMVWRVGTADIRLDMEDYGRGAGTAGRVERAVWVTIGEHTVFGPAPLAICKAALAAISV